MLQDILEQLFVRFPMGYYFPSWLPLSIVFSVFLCSIIVIYFNYVLYFYLKNHVWKAWKKTVGNLFNWFNLKLILSQR